MTRLATIAALALALAACSKSGGGKAATSPDSDGKVHIDVTRDGFQPNNVNVPAGKPVTLVFQRKTDETCAKEVVMDVGGQKIDKELPLDQPVEVAVTFPKAGAVTYACGMDMEHGTITVQ